MDFDTLRRELLGWSSLGPFREIEDLDAEMARAAAALGPEDAALLAEAMVRLAEEDLDLAGVLSDFMEHYRKHFPRELGAAALAALEPHGPPVLVDELGLARNAEALPRLRALFDERPDDEELRVAIACALGNIGGSEAAAMLRELGGRRDLAERVRREIDIALRNVGAGR